jgi:hypothetical protein
MWCGRHCREDEGSKVGMIWIRNEGELVRDYVMLDSKDQRVRTA